MSKKRYVVTSGVGIDHRGFFFPFGSSLYLTETEFKRYALGAEIEDPEAPGSDDLDAAPIAQAGDVLILRRNGKERVISPTEAVAYVEPLVTTAPPVPDPVVIGLDLSQPLSTENLPVS